MEEAKEVYFYAFESNDKRVSIKTDLKTAHLLYDQFVKAADFPYLDITVNGKVLRSYKNGGGSDASEKV
jgi:hypothetical protein